MATVYIDPTVGGTGTGSFVDPFRSWSSVTWAAGNTYLQKSGTTALTNLIVGAGGTSEETRVTVGSYDASDGSVSDSKAIIDGRTGFGARAITLSATTSFVTIQDLDVIGGNSGTSRRCVGATGNSLLLRRLICRNVTTDSANDCDGIFITGDNCVVEDCEVYDIADDGIFISASVGPVVRRCRVYRVSTSGRSQGDCLQLTGNCTGAVVEDNFLDHSDVASKQAFILSGASSGSAAQILRNYCSMPPDPSGAHGTACIYVDQPGCRVIGNIVVAGSTGIMCDGATNATLQANVIKESYYGMNTANSPTGIAVRHNVVMDAVNRGCNFTVADATTVVNNNIFLRCVTGAVLNAATTRNYNAYFGNSTNVSGGSIDANVFTVDPQLDSRYLPRNASLLNVGTYVGGYDYYGKEWGSPPNIGAVENWPARSVATRTVSSFSPAASSRTIRTRTATI